MVGAGISGLTAAYELTKLGYDVTVFEAEESVGCKIKSVYLEDGFPTTKFLDLTPEAAEAAAELCGDEVPTELGAVYTTADGFVAALADELGVPYGKVTFQNKIVVSGSSQTLLLTTDEYLGLVGQQLNPGLNQMEVAALVQEQFLNFQNVAATFPQIFTARLDGQANSDLALPLTEFARKYNIDLLIEATRPLATGYGYGYYDSVPAAYLLKLLQGVLRGSLSTLVGFPCGFQSLPEAIAAELKDVRLNAKVESVRRKKNFVEVKVAGQPRKERFKHVVFSTTLDLIPSILDVSETEKDLFGRMTTLRYITTYAGVEGLQQPGTELYFFADQGFEVNINSINILGKSDEVPGSFYQIVDRSITTEEAFEILSDDLDAYFEADLSGDIIAQEDWLNYFPTVSSEDFKAGFYDKMEELQGIGGVYYVGSQFSFETTNLSSEFASELILRKFAAVGP